MSGGSWVSRSDADPYFTRSQVDGLVRGYLDGRDATTPEASPLFATLVGHAPTRIHVGDDEVLLDDAVRYGRKAAAAGADVTVDVWEGMPHGFVSGVGRLAAANAALGSLCPFLTAQIAA